MDPRTMLFSVFLSMCLLVSTISANGQVNSDREVYNEDRPSSADVIMREDAEENSFYNRHTGSVQNGNNAEKESQVEDKFAPEKFAHEIQDTVFRDDDGSPIYPPPVPRHLDVDIDNTAPISPQFEPIPVNHWNADLENPWIERETEEPNETEAVAIENYTRLREEIKTMMDKLCFEAPAVGNGNEIHLRFYFDEELMECRKFHYSGSGGNKNNFETIEQCDQICQIPQV